jgi:hypothetical protein
MGDGLQTLLGPGKGYRPRVGPRGLVGANLGGCRDVGGLAGFRNCP